MQKWKNGLKGLSLFFKILPISNTSVCAAYNLATIQFAYWDWKVSKRFIGLIWLQQGQIKQPHYTLAPATNTISNFIGREMSQLPTRLCGQGHWISKLHGLCPIRTPINNERPPLKKTPCLILRAIAKGSRKTIDVFSLSLTQITIWSAS